MHMTWEDGVKTINKNKPYYTNLTKFAEIFNMVCEHDGDDYFHHRMKKYWICSEKRSGKMIGTAAYYFDDELVAVSIQRSIYSEEIIHIISVHAYNKLRDFVFDCISLERSVRFEPFDLTKELDVSWSR